MPSHPQLPAEVSDRESPRPTGELTLRQAVKLSLENSPELNARNWDTQRVQARARQAGLWLNPELEVEMENFGGNGKFSGSAAAETTISLAKSIPLGGDFGQRRQIASLEMQLADWDYQTDRLELLLEVTRRFIDAAASDRRLALSRNELELAKATENITRSRVEAGDASPVEMTRVIVPVVTAEVDLKRAERSRDLAYHKLALQWGARDVSFNQVIGDLERLSPVPTPQKLAERINENPAIARWATEISVRITERRLAKAKAIPDIIGRFGVRQDRGADAESLVVAISLPLPIFDRSQGDILAAKRGELAARERRRSAELHIENMLGAAYAKLLSAQDEALALRQRALPAANQAYESTQLAFQEGKLQFLDVLDAQRTLFELQRRYLDALVDYHSMAAEIESLVGQPLNSFIQ